MTSRDKEISKEYISDSIQDIELLFFNSEKTRLETVKYPFYDGGLTPIVIYYTRKYKLPIKFPNFIEEINGSTLFQITSNFYPYNMDRLNLKTTEYDLFSTQYVKNYFFLNNYYDIKVIYNKIKGLYESKQLNQDGEFYWMAEIQNLLLSFLAVKEKISLGFNDKNYSNNSNNSNNSTNSNNSKEIFNNYFDFIKEITDEYLVNYPDKQNKQYMINFWIYQLLNPKSKVIKSEGLILINSLLKKRNKNKLWEYNYITNWILYGLIKDYLGNNLDFFFNSYSLKDIAKGMVYEEFENPKAKSKGKKSKSKSSKSSKSTKSKKKKSNEKFDNVNTSKKEFSWWKTILLWIALPFIIFFGIRVMMFFWNFVFIFISK
jgi:hypothetical protein